MPEVMTMSRRRYQREEVCGGCKHFRLHYIKSSDCYFPTHLGHCVHPMVKDRRADERYPRWAPPDQA